MIEFSPVVTETDSAVELAKVAERIRALREKHGYSEQYVADYVGISQPAYRKYEHGGGVTAEKLLKLCELYGCSADYILALVENEAEILAESKLPKDEQNFLKLLRTGNLPVGFRRLLGGLDLPEGFGEKPAIDSGDKDIIPGQ